MNFSDLIGQKVFVQTTVAGLDNITNNGSAALVQVTGIDPGGIWILHEGMTEDLAKLSSAQHILKPRAGVEVHVFLPYSSIPYAAYRSPRLDEHTLGLTEAP